MAKNRRNSIWFWVLLVVLLLGGYLGMTIVVAGSDNNCNGGPGSITFRSDIVPPRFVCQVGFRY